MVAADAVYSVRYVSLLKEFNRRW